ncbi:hypothetical protein D3C87_1936320 [compost metagenome]
MYARVGNHRFCIGPRNLQDVKYPFRKAAGIYRFFDGSSTAHHIRCVLQQHRITADQDRAHGAVYLPVGEVPGHNRQYGT